MRAREAFSSSCLFLRENENEVVVEGRRGFAACEQLLGKGVECFGRGSRRARARTLNLLAEGRRNSAPAPLDVGPNVLLLLLLFPRRLEPIRLLLARACCPSGLFGLDVLAGAVAVAAVQHCMWLRIHVPMEIEGDEAEHSSSARLGARPGDTASR